MDSLQLLSCVVPTVDEKSWDDLPRIHEMREKSDNRLLSTRTLSSSSSSIQQERRQYASSSKAADSQENRHKASPPRAELYKQDIITPPSSVSKNRAITTPHQTSTDYITSAKTKPVVTPEQHIDFIRDIFSATQSDESLKYARRQCDEKYIQSFGTTTTKPTSRILLPVLSENETTEWRKITLGMRREGNPFHDFFDERDAPFRSVETRNMISSASGVLYEPGRSVKTLARSPRADVKYKDEKMLLQEAKLEIANVKEFLRVNSIRNEKNCKRDDEEEDEVEMGIETLLLKDDQVAVMEESLSCKNNSKFETRIIQRRISFGDKPPRPPQSPQDYPRYHQRFEV